MVNASYNSRRVEALPVQSWSKAKLMEWLDEKGIILLCHGDHQLSGIAYPDKALKKKVWAIAKACKPSQVRYVIDEMAAKHGNNTCTLCMYIYIVGHEVVRLPVAHCELNPIQSLSQRSNCCRYRKYNGIHKSLCHGAAWNFCHVISILTYCPK